MKQLSSTLGRAAVAAVLAAAAAAAHADNTAYQTLGTLEFDNSASFFDISVSTTSDLRVWTTVGFDSVLSLFDLSSGALISFSDDINNPYPQVGATQSPLDAGLLLTDLAPGSYRAALTLSPNYALGPTLSEGFTLDGQTPNAGPGFWVAEVRLNDVSAVPEPATWMLVGLGVSGLLLRRSGRSQSTPARGK